jgi:hypothetical protein
MSIDYNLDEVITESVASITAKLSEMSDLQLLEMRGREEAGPVPRKSLLTAIDAEVAGRVEGDIATADADPALAIPENAAAENAAAENTAPEIDVAVLVAEHDQALARVAELEAELAASKKPAACARDPKALAMVADDAADDLLFVVFGDDGDQSLPQIPGLLFDADAFAATQDGGLVLQREIAFPVHGPANDVCSVWLVGKDRKRGKVCRLMAPLATGGGRAVVIPGGHLRFSA